MIVTILQIALFLNFNSMENFKVFSKACPHCRAAVQTLRSTIAEQGCGCAVEEVTCDGLCESAKHHGFSVEELPVILREDVLVHRGTLSTEQAASLLPA